jgi:hypothetical protein
MAAWLHGCMAAWFIRVLGFLASDPFDWIGRSIDRHSADLQQERVRVTRQGSMRRSRPFNRCLSRKAIQCSRLSQIEDVRAFLGSSYLSGRLLFALATLTKVRRAIFWPLWALMWSTTAFVPLTRIHRTSPVSDRSLNSSSWNTRYHTPHIPTLVVVVFPVTGTEIQPNEFGESEAHIWSLVETIR